MKVEYEKGCIKFNLFQVIEYIPDEQKLELVERLACEEAVIKHVTDMLLNGWTENGSYGPKMCDSITSPEEGTTLDKAVRRIALGAGEVAKKEIERLQRDLFFQKEQAEKYRNDYFKLYHKDTREKYL